MTTADQSAMLHADLLQILNKRKRQFQEAGIATLEVRKARLQACIDLLVDNQQDLAEAIRADFGYRHPYSTLLAEVYQSINHFKNAIKQLPKWMRSVKRRSPGPMALFGARTRIHYQPKGVVGIVAPWNYPLAMVVNPLCYALAAGNVAMIKPSELTPRVSELMKLLFERYFPNGEVTVVTGAVEVGQAFCALPFDHLFFTGAGHVGRKVMEAAARNLTPVTLELGGKSPAIVSTSARLPETVEKLVAGKCLNAGQVCVSPDYAFVHESQLEEFIGLAKDAFEALYPADADYADFTSVIDQRNYQRIDAMLRECEDMHCRIESLGRAAPDPQRRLRVITLVVDPPAAARVSQEELFGPLLVVRSYRDITECYDYINGHDKPLAMYYFGQDKAEQTHTSTAVFAGGMSINDVLMQVACVDSPFGGIGPSGMGSYHGPEGFLTFSHAKTVFKAPAINLQKLGGMLPPYSDKVGQMLAKQIKK